MFQPNGPAALHLARAADGEAAAGRGGDLDLWDRVKVKFNEKKPKGLRSVQVK